MLVYSLVSYSHYLKLMTNSVCPIFYKKNDVFFDVI